MSNVALFRNFLLAENIHMNEGSFEDGSVYFMREQTIENGGNVLLAVHFNQNEDIVDLKVLGIAKITNPLKKEQFHSLINQLNTGYRFTKFYEQNGEISATYSMFIGERHNPQDIIDTLIMVYNSCSDNYGKFMKLVWA